MLVSQLKHMKTADLGFNKEDIIIIPARGDSNKEYEVIKNELIAYPEILEVTTASDIPDNINYGEIEWGSTQEMVHENQAIARIIRVGYDFDKTFGLYMEEGRFFSRDHATDAGKGIVINRETANILGYEDPVDKPFYLFGDEYTIIGMVEDFQFFPLNLGGKAMFMVFSDEQPLIFLKYRSGNAKEAINYTQEVFQEYNSNYPFEYFFYDDFDRVLNKIGSASSILLIYLSFFGIFISCLGLLGLAIYSAEIRTKEFGIRKAFGATVKQIVYAQSKEFAWLIFIAHLIAVPLAYLLLSQVLKLFAYKIDLSVWYFIITMIGIYTLSFLTTGWQAFSAARRNPVEALRYE
jgi:ABC-type antimicrobial peptide transport system permease subunit